jgi:hypothetical protein
MCQLSVAALRPLFKSYQTIYNMASLSEVWGIPEYVPETIPNQSTNPNNRRLFQMTFPSIPYEELRQYARQAYDGKSRYYHPQSKLSFIHKISDNSWICMTDSVMMQR